MLSWSRTSGSGRPSYKARDRCPIERVQTGVRLEKRIVKVLKALAEPYDLSLGEFLEDRVRDAFAVALAQAAELMRIYGLPPTAPNGLAARKEERTDAA